MIACRRSTFLPLDHVANPPPIGSASARFVGRPTPAFGFRTLQHRRRGHKSKYPGYPFNKRQSRSLDFSIIFRTMSSGSFEANGAAAGVEPSGRTSKIVAAMRLRISTRPFPSSSVPYFAIALSNRARWASEPTVERSRRTATRRSPSMLPARRSAYARPRTQGVGGTMSK